MWPLLLRDSSIVFFYLYSCRCFISLFRSLWSCFMQCIMVQPAKFTWWLRWKLSSWVLFSTRGKVPEECGAVGRGGHHHQLGKEVWEARGLAQAGREGLQIVTRCRKSQVLLISFMFPNVSQGLRAQNFKSMTWFLTRSVNVLWIWTALSVITSASWSPWAFAVTKTLRQSYGSSQVRPGSVTRNGAFRAGTDLLL